MNCFNHEHDWEIVIKLSQYVTINNAIFEGDDDFLWIKKKFHLYHVPNCKCKFFVVCAGAEEW